MIRDDHDQPLVMPGAAAWSGRLAVPATVRAVPQPPEELVALARQQAPDPEVFAAHPPFFLTATISTAAVDAYGTRMRLSTLKRFAEDASAGVAILYSHRVDQLPIGRSVRGRLVGGKQPRVVADGYILAGLTVGEVTTDDIIAGIQGGIYRDVSVGFYGGRTICSICGVDMFGWETTCPHFPGQPVTTESGEQVIAIGEIEDARLSEWSLVYDGATPGAAIEKAYRLVAERALPPAALGWVAARYQLPVAGAAMALERAAPAGEPLRGGQLQELEARHPTSEREETMREEMAIHDPPPAGRDHPIEPAEREQVRRALARVQAPATATVEWLADELLRLRAEVDRLTPLAAQGEAYREQLIEDRVRAAVRLHGPEVAVEALRAKCRKLTLDEIRAEIAADTAAADRLFAGGRQTIEDDPPAVGGPTRRRPPDRAFAI
ncbi:MAG: hypothetical protein KatS3mg060_1173 [Dehalococcoidia bacterium]|nr:MAG: hypothetical protein KatS3mg060_1173 [Dehalococcoidia bacterium]